MDLIKDNSKLKYAYEQVKECLLANNIHEFVFETRIIFEDLLGYSPSKIKLHGDSLLTSDEVERLNNCLKQRFTGKPLAYIIGKAFFWNNFFKVNEHTLIPRQDTETLMVEILKLYPTKTQDIKILDLGTGSGCIILSLLDEYKNSQAMAIDISADTLAIAQENALSLNLEDRVKFIQSNWFDELDSCVDKFDLIVSNPPYIDVSDPFIAQNVAKFEPKQALYAKNNGLQAYEIIISQARNFLKAQGRLVLEIGWQQWESVQALALRYDFSSYLVKDISQNPRCAVLECKTR